MTLRTALLLGAALLAVGCTRTPDPGPVQPEASVPLRLAVGGVEVQDQVRSVPVSFIDKRRSDELAAESKAYLQKRYLAGGGAEFGKIIIEKASILEQPRARRGGIMGFFTREAKTELVGTLATRVAITDGYGVEKAYARAEAELKRPVLEGSPVLERDRIARTLIRDLLAAQDRALQTSVDENLGAYTGRGAPTGGTSSPYAPPPEPYPPIGQSSPPAPEPYPPAGDPYPPAGEPYPPASSEPYPSEVGAPQPIGAPRPLIPPG